MKRNFNEWLDKCIDSIADFKFYTDFNKVYEKVNAIKIELNLLNSLIKSKNIENDFRILVKKYPEVLKAIPILLAKRGEEIVVVDKGEYKKFNFQKQNYSIDEYVKFMDETGLFNLLSNHIIADLLDYVKGVEVGLDTNARKNRSGTAMEDLVESFIEDAGFVRGISYFKELTTSEIRENFGIKLQLSTVGEHRAEKRFDFIIKSKKTVYAMEVNFYSGGGSKLNETARSYKMLAQETKNIAGFKFVWITDGIGWRSARRNLEETFDVLEHLYNINDLKNGILNNITK